MLYYWLLTSLPGCALQCQHTRWGMGDFQQLKSHNFTVSWSTNKSFTSAEASKLEKNFLNKTVLKQQKAVFQCCFWLFRMNEGSLLQWWLKKRKFYARQCHTLHCIWLLLVITINIWFSDSSGTVTSLVTDSISVIFLLDTLIDKVYMTCQKQTNLWSHKTQVIKKRRNVS
jgi:hypothetical protein